MFDHVSIGVADIARSKKFYDAALKPLGFVLGPKGDGYAGFGPKDAPGLWLHAHAGPNPTGAHVAFKANDRAAVDRFHAEALKAGGKDNGKPGLRTDYSPDYYGAFVIDPDGNNVEAVCFKK